MCQRGVGAERGNHIIDKISKYSLNFQKIALKNTI